MDDKRITADEIFAAIDSDIKQITQRVADAINNAKDGSIVNDSEEPVRDPFRWYNLSRRWKSNLLSVISLSVFLSVGQSHPIST